MTMIEVPAQQQPSPMQQDSESSYERNPRRCNSAKECRSLSPRPPQRRPDAAPRSPVRPGDRPTLQKRASSRRLLLSSSNHGDSGSPPRSPVPNRRAALQKRTSSRRLLLNSSDAPDPPIIVRQPSRRCLQMLQRANSAPNVFDPKEPSRQREPRGKRSKAKRVRSDSETRNGKERTCPFASKSCDDLASSDSRRRNNRRCASARNLMSNTDDNSLHNARQPRRSTMNMMTQSLGRWDNPEGIQKRASMDNASVPKRHDNASAPPKGSSSPERGAPMSPTRSGSNPERGAFPVSPRRSISPQRNAAPRSPRRSCSPMRSALSSNNNHSSHSQSSNSSNNSSSNSSPNKPERPGLTQRWQSERNVQASNSPPALKSSVARSRSYTRPRNSNTMMASAQRTRSGDLRPQRPGRSSSPPPRQPKRSTTDVPKIPTRRTYEDEQDMLDDSLMSASDRSVQSKDRPPTKPPSRRSYEEDQTEETKKQITSTSTKDNVAVKKPEVSQSYKSPTSSPIQSPIQQNRRRRSTRRSVSPKKPLPVPSPPKSPTSSDKSPIDINLLGYMDLEQDAEREDEQYTKNLEYSNTMSHRRGSMESTVSAKSFRSVRSFGCAGGLPERFKARRASLGLDKERMAPGRAKSFFDTGRETRREDFGIRRRRHTSMDMTLGIVTGTTPAPPRRSSLASSSVGRRYSRTRSLQNFSGVVLGRASGSFRLQRTDTNGSEEARKRMQYRRSRSMDMTPSTARRARSPSPNDAKSVGAMDCSHNTDLDSRCDVSDVMTALSRNEEENVTLFTNSSNSSDSLRRGSCGSLSLHSLGTGCGSLSGSKQRHSCVSPKSNNGHKKSPMKSRTPINIADLVENMDNEEGDYIIFIGNKKDLASVKGSNHPSDENDDDDNSTYVSVGASVGAASFGVCSCHSSFGNSGNASYHTNNSNMSLGYRDPDTDKKLPAKKPHHHCEACELNNSSHHASTKKNCANKKEDADDVSVVGLEDDDDSDDEIHSDEEWSSDDDDDDDSDGGDKDTNNNNAHHESSKSKLSAMVDGSEEDAVAAAAGMDVSEDDAIAALLQLPKAA